MRKESIIAIVSGITIGVLVAFGIWRANSALISESSTASQTNTENQSERESSAEAQLTIMKPEENDVITSSPVKISGFTKPLTVLIISGEQNDYIVKSGEDGIFEIDVDLVGGVNDIIFAHPENGDAIQAKTLRIVYSTEFEKEESE